MRNTAHTPLLQRVISRICNAMGLVLPKPLPKIGVLATPPIPSAPHTNSQPAKRPRKPKSSPAQAVKQDKPSKPVRQLAQILEETPFPARGLRPAVVAKLSGKRKRKHSPVLPTTVAPLHKLVKQQQMDKAPLGKQLATPVFPILRPAKPASKRKP